MSSLATASRRVHLSSRAALWQCVPHCCFGTRPRMEITPPAPGHKLESVQPPTPEEPYQQAEPEPMAYVRKPVTSAHAIDLSTRKLSARDSVAISPAGTVVHGRYGDLGPDVAQGIPLEYLALLQPAAEGTAALRVILEKSSGSPGTLLVYGASQPNAMATVQLASTAGHAVIAVVGGEHAGNSDMVDTVKGLAAEPGTAVPEEYALVKRNFDDLVEATIKGDNPSNWDTYDPDVFLKDFKENLLEYAKKYPPTRPAAVDESHLEFRYADKDREYFRDNMDAYLSQLPAGSPAIDRAKLDAYFDKDQYAIFKSKFGKQTTAVITGDETADFNPPHVVKALMDAPEKLDDTLKQEPVEGAGPFIPYEFSVLKQDFGKGVEPKAGGPVLGAVIAVTPTLEEAANAVQKAGDSLRAKAEALQFLTHSHRHAYASATSVVNQARKHNAPVFVVGGSLPGFESVEPTDEDVQEALAAMEIDETGTSRINYFVQVYRAGDFPVYADYAIHRATEELAGPRQIVVTK